ncbi:transposase [Azospirillum formosense]|uniref:transposase n=1 Tax=Azospirillum formosense TaxID=861533 RepID=UPI001C9288FB|nr:hypothetical protein [Azospirillum formosense]
MRLALRQTEGLIASVLQQLGLDLPVPVHPTLARHARTVTLRQCRAQPAGPFTCWWTAPG